MSGPLRRLGETLAKAGPGKCRPRQEQPHGATHGDERRAGWQHLVGDEALANHMNDYFLNKIVRLRERIGYSSSSGGGGSSSSSGGSSSSSSSGSSISSISSISSSSSISKGSGVGSSNSSPKSSSGGGCMEDEEDKDNFEFNMHSEQ